MSICQNFGYQKKDSKRKKSKKILLNTAEDLIKISNEDFDKINISNLYGGYYEQIYKEALEIEKKNAELLNKKKSKDKHNGKYKANNHHIINNKNKTNVLKGILKKTQRDKIGKRKSRSKSKEKNLLIKKPNYKIMAEDLKNITETDVNDNKHLFSPEIPSKMKSFIFKEDTKNKKDNKEAINNKNNSSELISSNNQKIKVNLLPNFDKKKINGKNKLNNEQINKNNDKENEIKFNFNKYKSDEIKNNKITYIDNKYKINKIIFYIRYDSNYGDNIGILGSIEKLGNWSQDKILYLKWNNGNIWKGEITIDNTIINHFEFKFINRHDGIIYWEKGFNNVVDLKALIEELRYQKKGRYNKYEYSYDINNFEIMFICKIKGWE